MNTPPSKFRDWASMARLPNIPTVWSCVFTAWVGFEGPTIVATNPLFFLGVLVGGTLLYFSGTILNDVADVGFDRVNRPERPIPAKRISRQSAMVLAVCFWCSGGLLFLSEGSFPVMPLLLMVAIIVYTLLHKRHPWLAVPLMGFCRAALVLSVITTRWGSVGYNGDREVLWASAYACSVWFYVSGISFLALGETNVIRRKMVGWMLALLPGLDAIFLVCAGHALWVSVPLACFVLVLLLRRYASAT